MKRYTVFLVISLLLSLLFYHHPLSAQTTGSISGVVTALDGTTPITNATVCVRDFFETMGYGCFDVDPVDGTYLVDNLPAGHYRVEANAPGKENELYPDTPFYNLAQAIVLTPPDDITDINFTLGPGAAILGIINGVTLPLPERSWMCVNSFDSNNHVRCRPDVLNYSTGEFAFDHLPSGIYRVDIHVPGYVRQYYGGTWDINEASSIEVSAPTNVTGIEFNLEVGGGFSGVVTEADGVTPLTQAQVCVNDYNSNNHHGCVPTNEIDGSYLIDILPTQDVRINVMKEGYVNLYYPSSPFYNDAQPLSVVAGEIVTNINFSLEQGGSISGTVNAANGGELNNVTVCVNTFEANQHIQCRGVGDTFQPGPNTYTFDGLPTGTYRVNVLADDYRMQYYNGVDNHDAATPVSVTAPDDTANINFLLIPAGKISGHVFSADGLTPLANIPVDVITGGYGRCTDSNGFYQLDNLPLDTPLIIQAGGQGWPECVGENYLREWWQESNSQEEATPITLSQGANQFEDNINFTLDTGGRFSGIITQSDGITPIVNAQICMNGFENYNHYGCVNSHTDGTYLVQGLPTNPYLVIVYKQGYADTYYPNTPYHSQKQPLNIVAGELVSDVDFALLQGGSISGTISATDAGTLTNVVVCVNTFDTNEHILCRNDIFQAGTNTYTFSGLPTDNYRLNVWADNYRQQFYNGADWYHEASPVQVTAPNDTPNINFNLAPAGTIRGTVFEADGVTPIANVPVDLNTGGYGRCTDENGFYQLENLPLDTPLIIQAGGQGWPFCPGTGHQMEWWQESASYEAATPITLSLGANQIVNDVDFTLIMGGTISGTVTGPGGSVGVHVGYMGDGFGDPHNGPATCTNPDGTYTIHGLQFDVSFAVTAGYHGECGNLHGYATEWWEDSPTYLDAQLITLTEIAPAMNSVNFALEQGGFITGNITDAATGQPLVNMAVWVDFAWLGTCTDENGDYVLERVMPNVDLYIKSGGFDFCGGNHIYEEQTWGDPTAVVVLPSETVGNINMALVQPSTSTVVLLTPPHNSISKDTTPTFTWQAVDNAKRYRLQVAKNIDFAPVVFTQLVTDDTSFTSAALGGGEYFWRVQVQLNGSSDWSAWSDVWEFTIDITKPAKPAHTQPANALTVNEQPSFEWSAISDAAYYQIQIDDKADFSSPLYTEQVDGTSFTPPVGLDDGMWYWRVQAFDEAGNKSGWTAAWSVRVDAVPALAPVLLTPVDEFVTRINKPIYTWEAIAGAKKYRLQVSAQDSFSSLLVNITTKQTTYKPEVTLPKGQSYWRVSVLAADGLWSGWSEVFMLTVDRTAPAAPVLVSPAHKAIIADTNMPTFDWEDNLEIDIAGYIIEVDNNKDFSSPLFTVEVTDSTYTTTIALSNRNYFWRVRGIDAVGNRGPWSAQRKFTINQLRFRGLQ